MIIKMKSVFLSCCMVTACGSATPSVSTRDEPKPALTETQSPLTDGVYSIRQIAKAEGDIEGPDGDEQIVSYVSDDTTMYFLIGKIPDVSFDLKKPVTKAPNGEDTFSIFIEFDDTSKEKLSSLTRDLAEIGGHVANIIGGEVVSYHKVKEEITEGKVMVTCCDFSACERLMGALKDRGN